MPIKVDLHDSNSEIRVKPESSQEIKVGHGPGIDIKRLEALIRELQETKQDLGFIPIDEFLNIDTHQGTIPGELLNLLINYLINKISLFNEVYYLVLSDNNDALVYYCSNADVLLNQVIINKQTGNFFVENHPIKHSVLSNLDFLTSGHTGFAGIEFGTTDFWNMRRDYVPPLGMLVVYTDYSTTEEGVLVPNFKIGDGNAHLIDKPFVGADVREILEEHVADMTIHITQQEREKWNNKLNYVEPDTDLLKLTRD